MQNSYLKSSIKQFEYYKSLGDKTFIQLNSNKLFWSSNNETNSIAIIVKHVAGNMLSRWTNFLTEDGEKEWRNRDEEFINSFTTKEDVLTYWETGWDCLFKTLQKLKKDDLERIIYIRNQGHTATEAINRQLCHYAYHIGQIVLLAKIILESDWKTLSIPKNTSENYSKEKFNQKKVKKHFTDDL